MLELLTKYNYHPPQLKKWHKENTVVAKYKNDYTLIVDNERWMTYDNELHSQAGELFSHYFLANGHCICTGMGFGVRENWLLSKKEVTKITIIEKNKNVLKYNEYIKSPFLKECEIIIGDASELNQKCDTLLLDHYEMKPLSYILRDAREISNNVDCENFWFWPLESIIMRYKSNDEYSSYFETYKQIKIKHKLNMLPNLNEDTINLFCSMFDGHNLKNKNCMG